ncbi:hypothetical protein DSO57_1028029 [Entomophthora muscae]|uniref:Uncharacterized protein n=1 Tax=Entomophthora muscae TaxID=34485 RepID=A0ACC2SQJ1_9FUNG|nr:hypothetical protein DSO57_1028029 [Entomophthora muscae]
MVSPAGPWALEGQSASYLIKLAPLLWWTLPSSQQSKLAAKANRPPPGMCDRHQAANLLVKSASNVKDLILSDTLKNTKDGEMFLLCDNGQEVEDRIKAYNSKHMLEQLNTATTWLCDSTFAICPSSLIRFGSFTGSLTPKLSPLCSSSFLMLRQKSTPEPSRSSGML